MLFIPFIILWFAMFGFQFTSRREVNKNIDFKYYVFYSNLRVKFPAWFIILLFLNKRNTKIPITIAVQQIINYVFLVIYCVGSLTSQLDPLSLLKTWFTIVVVIAVIMLIDFFIYTSAHKEY